MPKILVVEDEASIRSNILELLEYESFESKGAENGALGLRLAQEWRPDLILCDVMMPEMDGYAMLTALRQDPKTATVPLVFLTAKVDKAALRQGMNLGADDYLTKPFSRVELLEAIEARLTKQAVITEQYQSELKQAEAKISHLLYYDNVTDLPNRLLLREKLHQALTQSKTTAQAVAILCIRLNRLKQMSGALESTEQHSLMRLLAARLRTAVPDSHTVAQLQEDQFIVILPAVDQRQVAASTAQSIQNVLSEPLALKNERLYLTTSIGITLYPADGLSIDMLLKNADLAAEAGQQQGSNHYQFYTPALNVRTADQVAIEASLYEAVARSEFQLHYQPQVNLGTGQIVGAEALLRWHPPAHGPISPAVFVPLAEATGLIVPIGAWVLQTACEQAITWQRAGLPPLRMAVNLSARQFNQPDLSAMIAQTLQATGLAPDWLELEITESCVMQHPEAAIATLNTLKALGVQISLDDFGTGYSSLSYLQQFPFDILKIDQCFVRDLDRHAKNQVIVGAVTQMAHNLGLKVIAEGVETAAELHCLQQYHCDAIQGYFFSRPQPATAFAALLQAGKRL